jgi:glycerol-3-phosphate cytidylyltransferase
MKRYKCAITYGTYDLFHIGHLNLLERIAQLADKLIVAVSTDEFNALKGKRTVIPYQELGRFDFLKQYCEVLYLPRTEGISTTIIRETMPVKKN